ncbi:Mur ligase family protein, partial [Patescibacteria group bacterium]
MNKYLLIYQLEEYNSKRFLNWVFKNFFRRHPPRKKEITWTNKSKLILLVSWVLLVTTGIFLFVFIKWYFALVVLLFLWLNNYLLLLLSNFLLSFPEKYKRKKYIENATAKLSSIPNIKKIGITGSAGKTSTKNILAGLLSTKTLSTPKSYNTDLGITKVIDFDLNHRYKNFIVEMGAYKTGEIKNLCEIVKPNIGILTSINEQHLERFKTIENTISAKFEILQNLSEPSVGIVNLDNPLILENIKKAQVMRLIGYSLENKHSEFCQSIVRAKNITFNHGVTEFETKMFDQEYKLQTNLLGKNHLSNILAAITCAIELGETPEKIAEKLKDIKSIPHRLELKNYNGINILDDTYSSNVAGFREALRVLSGFKGKKVIATPG